jgi:peptidylprolyl isomerase
VRVRTSARRAGIVASVVVTALTLSAVAACGSSASAKSAGDVTVSGEFDKQPTNSVPKGKPPATTDVKVISRGSGPALKSGDLAVVDGYGRTWDDATTFENTYTSDAVPDTLPVGTGQIALTGLDKALLGVPTGSRVLIVLPPKEGFGLASQLPTGVQKTDTAVLVFDVLGGYQSNAGPSGQQVSSGGGDLPTVTSAGVNQKPTVAIPKSDPPAKLSVTTLVKGDGPAVAKGQELVVQYLGQIWASGNEFDSSWKRGQPTAFTVGAGQLIQAWDDGLVGVPVGSRVLIVAPPDSAYGAAGQPSAGIAGTDTLVFVVDVLGAYSP